ncbi:MAG TPA: CBS domain-containing protein [Actinomycetota bacterium]|nr:CBS domain-containing protein [Actinomycetota bacterium]
MTTAVVTVSDSAPFKQIVRLLHEHRISALPVVDPEGRVVGVVSEADLLLKEEYEPPGEGKGGLIAFGRKRRERRKATGLVARQLMTQPAVTVSPEATVQEAARLMHARRVKRLPVVDAEGRVVGIVSRADLLKVFLRSDEEIQKEVAERILYHTLWLEPGTIRAEVRDGIVHLEGTIEQRSMIPMVVALVQGVDGVVGVDNRLEYVVDDVSQRPTLPPTWGLMPDPSQRY